MAARPTLSIEQPRSQRARCAGQSDEEFLTSLIARVKLPHTDIVRAQLRWILRSAEYPIATRATFVPRGHKTLREFAVSLRKALRTIEKARCTMTDWSEGLSEDADFYRTAIRTALTDSAIVPEELIVSERKAHYTRRVERLLPNINDGLSDELRKIEAFASASRGRVKYDPNERMFVQLLWLIFESSGCRVTLGRRGSVALSRFQQACVAIFDRTGFVHCPENGPKTKISSNLQNRIIDAVQAGQKNKTLDRIRNVTTDERDLRVNDVDSIMSVWTDWLCISAISEETSKGRKKSDASP